MAAPPPQAQNPSDCSSGSGGRRIRLLPGDHLFSTLAPYLGFADHLALRLVSRSWRFFCRRVGRSPPPFPWLMLPQPASAGGPSSARHAPAPASVRRQFYDIPGGRAYAYDIPGEGYYRCVASSTFGWLVLVAVDAPPRRLLLVNPLDPGTRMVVSWPFGDKQCADTGRLHAALAPYPDDRRHMCFLVLATDRLLAYCGPGDGGAWRSLRVPGFRYDAAGSDMVVVGSMVYLVDGRGKIWRADLADPEPKVERRNPAFPLPSGSEIGVTRRHYLVESLGHVHLVVLSGGDSEHRCRVALFRLDWDRKAWAREDCARGNRVLLLGRGCSASVPAAPARRPPGMVLFAHQPSLIPVAGGGGSAWFWVESWVDHDLPVLKKKTQHQEGEFTNGDSFWFFPAMLPDLVGR
ncbi:hypothetical protein BRADI_3g32860v3 [Brachypodium distachyon]|uniref:KIB1-4 beta-propeller domain-containing protein n=1 Tax=Brachypodium distachyon TaxID=15368 RepID=A0A2K2D0N9_BRADI|nr:hypothetical protein BRADI_3g32860v3 [Brachypodium distachyon]